MANDSNNTTTTTTDPAEAIRTIESRSRDLGVEPSRVVRHGAGFIALFEGKTSGIHWARATEVHPNGAWEPLLDVPAIVAQEDDCWGELQRTARIARETVRLRKALIEAVGRVDGAIHALAVARIDGNGEEDTADAEVIRAVEDAWVDAFNDAWWEERAHD